MHIVLMASGSRGDVQPMLALGRAMKAVGHHVRLVAGSNFVDWIKSYGLDVFPTIDIEALMRSDLGVQWVESKGNYAQFKAMKAVMLSVLEPSVADMIDGTQGAELIVGGLLMEASMQAISEQRAVPYVSAALQPFRPTRSGAASIVPLVARGDSPLNRWMGLFSERMMLSTGAAAATLTRQKLGLGPYSTRAQIRAARTIPTLYAFSRFVVPPADDTGATTTGYWFLDETFTPPDDLAEFIAAGDAPVYVGFGSMPASDPQGTVRMVADALARVGQRGVMARGWSGAQVHDVPGHVFLLDKVPHDWLFPRMKAVVHHGGAGTTAAGLRAGKPALVVPHMSDQPYWARRVHELGVGVKPLQRHELSVESLTQRLDALLNAPDIGDKAAALGKAISAERGVDNAVQWFEDFIARRKGSR